ncbi:23S rRNA (uracil(747)-C(5))-methyltransferase RlmC [Cellulomonas sp. McL0617]|uniref:23S rRNA (uracil(747)-C(5))-methyltransferase RlmC n=1 Tax=Cellulomonas sp. McL0617 TaxID=3415675 RepID=UPI003CEA789F
MRCAYFDAELCRSCAWMGRPYGDQLAAKQAHAESLIEGGPQWLAPHASAESGYRNKAKMVVTGTAAEPTLGILDAAGHGVDLLECGLYDDSLQAAFPVLAAFVAHANLTPYDLATRTGELKNLLVTQSPDGELMVRFVLRSQEPVTRIRKHLPALLDALPVLRVASVNLLPDHRAVLEGDREIPLTEQETLLMRVNGIDLHLRPQSFFQTNTEVAAALYRQATAWIDDLSPASVWDLYCGVGGFALHVAAPGRDVVGIETSVEAVASARLSSDGLAGIRFEAADATAFAQAHQAPELVIVNPPRRGIGAQLAGYLEASSTTHVVYSSCNAESLARDLAAMPSLRPVRAQLLDMFPQTTHYEVLTLLARVQ